jgi:hypothetical protein
MKLVGKPDAGNPHVRFDERGGETDRSRDAAPLLDSTMNETVLAVTFEDQFYSQQIEL